MKILALPQPDACARFLEHFKFLEELAKTDQLTGFVYVATLTNGKVASSYYHDRNRSSITELMGEAEFIKQKMYEQLRDR